MKRKKIIFFSVLTLVVALLPVSNGSSIITEVNDETSSIVETGDHDFGVIGRMEIDGSADIDDICYVEMYDTSFEINNYIAGDTIRFSADYKIVKDVIGPWREAPYGVEPENHSTCIERWDFKISAVVNGYEPETIEEVKSILDCPWETPPETLLVQANSSVVEGEKFTVKVTFHGAPTYKDYGFPEEVTFNGETKTADPVTGIVNFTAPEVDEDTVFTITAKKDWNAVDEHHPDQGNVITMGETRITVLNKPDTLDLVVIAPSSVMERKDFEVLVKADATPVPGAIVIFNGIPHITNSEGKTTFSAPEVSKDKEYTIYANLIGFFDGETKITVHSDYDDEADTTDESGTTGTVTLEFSLPRRQFYRAHPSENGIQEPIEIEIQLSCYYNIWNYKGYPHWVDEDSGRGYGSLLMTIKNSPPDLTVTGPTSGKIGKSYSYTATAVDPDEDPIHYYEFLWGDKKYTFDNNDFHGFPSGTPCTHSHTWSEKGSYYIWVCAEDAIGDKTCISYPVTMPKVRRIDNLFYHLQLFKHPTIIEKIFNILL
ncbi:MAG: hypothetical protein DRM98_02290 [Thermoplasmata archaeon]|nr:MAG: hypothetical protein DRM98_02290 [Thermoplasmata archaeon]RLF53667.1 MAG: hypothetical protein DRN24_00145 [Thermoplasmata archaeon]